MVDKPYLVMAEKVVNTNIWRVTSDLYPTLGAIEQLRFKVPDGSLLTVVANDENKGILGFRYGNATCSQAAEAIHRWIAKLLITILMIEHYVGHEKFTNKYQ